MTRTFGTLLIFALIAAAGLAQAPGFAEIKKEAEAGQANAQYNLGVMYARGDDVPHDFVEAAKWFLMAAEQEYRPAQYTIGIMYKRGEGVPQDLNKAVGFITLAALHGHADAQYSLGGMYALGEGVTKDLVQAHFWLYSAYAREAEGAKETLTLVESQMTDAQKAESMKLVRALFSKYQLPKASSQ